MINTLFNAPVRSDYTLLDIISKSRKPKANAAFRIRNAARGNDTFVMSGASREISAAKSTKTNHTNTDIDKSIDLTDFIAAARKANEASLENAGTKIDRNAVKSQDAIDAMRAALNEKYRRASIGAAAYTNKEEYLTDKYFNKASDIYESDLTEEERRTGYINEKSYLETGRVMGVKMSDSLFRGMEFDGDVIDNDRLQRERQIINKQIENILSEAGIEKEAVPAALRFSVEPYSYYISVDCEDPALKGQMEAALNVGDNGRNLWRHIRKCAIQDGCNSGQYNESAYMKYQAFSQVKAMTGLRLDELEQRDGSFYTDGGENILDVVDKNISKSVPAGYIQQMREWIRELVSKVASRGWNNIPDLVLGIDYGKDGLRDIAQDIVYDGQKHRENVWYSVFGD